MHIRLYYSTIVLELYSSTTVGTVVQREHYIPVTNKPLTFFVPLKLTVSPSESKSDAGRVLTMFAAWLRTD